MSQQRTFQTGSLAASASFPPPTFDINHMAFDINHMAVFLSTKVRFPRQAFIMVNNDFLRKLRIQWAGSGAARRLR